MSNYAKCKWCGQEFKKKALNRFVSNNTLGIGGREKYCSEKCRMEAEAAHGGKAAATEYAGNSGGGTTIINKESGLASVIRAMKSEPDTTVTDDNEPDFWDERRKRKNEEKQVLEAKIEDLATIEFNNDAEDIQHQLNRLLTIAATKPEKKMRKALVEKLEFGIMKLSSAGAGPETAYFEGKLETFKKKGRL